MRWGVRKRSDGSYKKTGRTAKGRSDEPPSKDYKESRKLKSKGAQALSNKELRALNERLNLEQNYARMTQQKSKIERGHDYVKTAVGMARTASDIYNLYHSPAGKALREILLQK